MSAGDSPTDRSTFDGLDADSARALIVRLEEEARRLEAARIDLLNTITRDGLHDADGHVSAKVMMRHVAQLSAAEAATRDSVAKLMIALEDIAGAYRAGVIGTPQIRRLARTHRNPRVRDQMPAFEHHFLEAAIELEYVDFDILVTEWERLADEDGADQRSEVDHSRRDVKLIQDFNLAWVLTGRFGGLDGAEIDTILRHFTDAERLADIEAAKAEHGDEYRQHLPRTEAQRRADAVTNIFRVAAGAQPGAEKAKVTTNIVIDLATFEREIAKRTGGDIDQADPLDPTRICRTGDGTPLPAPGVVAHALTGHVRRVVFNSESTIVDQGRRVRLFTGSARDAAMLQAIRCYWPGCWIPASNCQIDHLEPYRDGGSTNPGNGAPACGRHNRLKEHDYRAWREPDGAWYVTRPDGTDIT